MKKSTAVQASPEYKLGDFVTLREFVVSGRGGSQFDTEDKLAWLLRLHRDELVAAGEFIPGRGARASLIGPGFDALAVEILRRHVPARSTATAAA